MCCLRDGMGWDIGFEGLLCWVTLMVDDVSGKLALQAAVFLRPLRPWVWEVLWGWSRSISGSWKMIHLAVFLKLPGAGEEGTLRLSIWDWDWATRLGTVISMIPSLSDVAYESRIRGEVASSKTLKTDRVWPRECSVLNFGYKVP